MDHALLALENSAFAFWLSQGIYPVILTIHSVGLALLVGLLVVIDLRVLGLGRGMPIPSLRRFMRVVWIGFGANAASGTLLFLMMPYSFFYNTMFRFKLLFIAAGLVIAGLLNASLLKVGDEYATASDPSLQQRALAALSIACWIAAIFSGRWLAYVPPVELPVL